MAFRSGRRCRKDERWIHGWTRDRCTSIRVVATGRVCGISILRIDHTVSVPLILWRQTLRTHRGIHVRHGELGRQKRILHSRSAQSISRRLDLNQGAVMIHSIYVSWLMVPHKDTTYRLRNRSICQSSTSWEPHSYTGSWTYRGTTTSHAGSQRGREHSSVCHSREGANDGSRSLRSDRLDFRGFFNTKRR